MTDIRTMFDKTFIGSWDLQGDTVVTITKVNAEKIKNPQEKVNKRPIIHFTEFDRPMVCNTTNANTISELYGRHVEKWAGKQLTLYATQVQAFGKTADCIRVRPIVPTPPAAKQTGLAFVCPDGEVKSFPKGGDWLAFAESTIAELSVDALGQSWDANSDTFYSMQAASTKRGDQAVIDRIAALGKTWHEKMNTPTT